jgi:hypothetical protein
MPLSAGVTVAGTTATGGVRPGCMPRPGNSCLHTEASVDTVGPMFDNLIHATSDDCRGWSGGIGGCRITGLIAGQRAYVLVFGHLYLTHGGHVPAGAISGFRTKLYVQGSDMMVGLANP